MNSNWWSQFKLSKRTQLLRAFLIYAIELLPLRKMDFSHKPRLHKLSQSQAGQDTFVCETLKKNTKHNYLEIGAGHPINNSNTFLLETAFGWKGFSWDISDAYINEWRNIRLNPVYIQDAKTINWEVFFQNAGKQFSYLSIDVNSPDNAAEILIRFLEFGGRFEICTFEHDAYVSPDHQLKADKVRILLEKSNYHLIAKNVKHRWREFEDWWVSSEILGQVNPIFKNQNCEGKNFFSSWSRLANFISVGKNAI